MSQTTDTDRTKADKPKDDNDSTGAKDDHLQGGDSVEANQAQAPDDIGGKVTPEQESTG